MFEEIVIVMIGETVMRTTFVCAHTLGASRKAYFKRHARAKFSNTTGMSCDDWRASGIAWILF